MRNSTLFLLVLFFFGFLGVEQSFAQGSCQDDQFPPVIVYPSQDIVVSLDPCDANPAIVEFEITVTDNCDGDHFPAAPGNPVVPGSEYTVTVLPVSGGATVASLGSGYRFSGTFPPGIHQVVIRAEDAAGNVREEDFFVVVNQDAAPPTNLMCNSFINITLNGDCQRFITSDMVLEGDFGCTNESDFLVNILDDNDPSNGNILDGYGEFTYQVSYVGSRPLSGWEDCEGTIIGEDKAAPDVNAPQDITVTLDPCDLGGVATVYFELDVVDNCDDIFEYTATILSPVPSIGVTITYLGNENFSGVFPPGIYNVSILVEDNAGNASAVSFSVTVNQDACPCPPLPITISGNDCFSGSSTRLTATSGPGYTYLWSNAETRRSINVPPGTYCVTVTETATGCTGTACITVCKKPTVAISPVSAVTICSGECITLKAMAGDVSNFQWSHSGPASATWTVCPASPLTMYTVTVTNDAGCTATRSITVKTTACNNEGGCTDIWPRGTPGDETAWEDAPPAEATGEHPYNGTEINAQTSSNGLVRAYPNPASHELLLDYSDQVDKIQSLALFNLAGRKIRDVEVSGTGSTRLDVSALPPGLYILNINGTMALRVALVR